jgi:hypothetical protein
VNIPEFLLERKRREKMAVAGGWDWIALCALWLLNPPLVLALKESIQLVGKLFAEDDQWALPPAVQNARRMVPDHLHDLSIGDLTLRL